MPTADQITDLTPIVEVARQAISRSCGLSVHPETARKALAALVGDDDNPGPLDRYEIRAYAAVAYGKPMVFWYCPRTHRNADGPGHLGVIARDLDGDQTGLTLGEILAEVLKHECEEHDDPTI
jgi:hypothetical protein